MPPQELPPTFTNKTEAWDELLGNLVDFQYQNFLQNKPSSPKTTPPSIDNFYLSQPSSNIVTPTLFTQPIDQSFDENTHWQQLQQLQQPYQPQLTQLIQRDQPQQMNFQQYNKQESEKEMKPEKKKKKIEHHPSQSQKQNLSPISNVASLVLPPSKVDTTQLFYKIFRYFC